MKIMTLYNVKQLFLQLHKQAKEEDVSVEDVDTTFDAESANKEELPMEEAHGIENREPENEEWESGTEDTAGVDHSVTGDAESGVGSSGSSTVKRSKISGLYKPPTREELQTLKETQTLFKSNLMRLQVHDCVIITLTYFILLNLYLCI